MAHKNEIQRQIMRKMRPAFIALSEIRLIAKIEDSEVNVSDDNMIRCDAENRNTGRDVVLFVRDDIKYRTILARKLLIRNRTVGVLRLYKGVISSGIISFTECISW